MSRRSGQQPDLRLMPVHWDGTLAGLERCCAQLRDAGAGGDYVLGVAYTSYLSRRVIAKPPPSGRVPVPSPEEVMRRQRMGAAVARAARARVAEPPA